MSGVYGHEDIFCPVCNKVTKHSTGWESEEPNVTDIQCIECYGERAISGHTYSEDGGYTRRLVQNQHLEAYCKAMDIPFRPSGKTMTIINVE